MVNWCSENVRLSGLGNASVRYIVEDAVTFLQREIRRGNRYEGIVMDPPSFGRGKGGELWKLSEHLPFLIDTAQEVLCEDPLFLLLNTYSDSVDDLAESMITKRLNRLGGSCNPVGLGLLGTFDQEWLPCGTSYRWINCR
jgi:23S rRNA (cytosine1962-C5)-methyltransferase